MSFRSFRSLADIADLWARDPQAPGDRDRLYRLLVAAVCDGVFFEHGLAIRAHAFLMSLDRDRQSYDPGALGGRVGADGTFQVGTNERLPDFQMVTSQGDLFGYVAPSIARHLPGSAAYDPAAFFDWVKNTDPAGHGEAVERLFTHVAVGKRGFEAWCTRSGAPAPRLLEAWPEQRPLDPNHRGPCPLPDAELITLCQAVTWLTTGRARPAPVLRRLMHRHRGGRWPRGLWRELEEDAVKLVAALRRGDIVAYGQLDGGPHAAMPLEYFVSDVFAEFAADVIAPDPLAWPRGTYPEGLPTYRAVRFRRDELWNKMRHAVREPDERGAGGRRPTVAAGKRCLHWLIELMRAGPPEAAKLEYKQAAIAKFGVSKRQFASNWNQAQQEVGNLDWAKPGPKPKPADCARRRLAPPQTASTSGAASEC